MVEVKENTIKPAHGGPVDGVCIARFIACMQAYPDGRWAILLYPGVVCSITHHYSEVPIPIMSLRLPDDIADTLARLAKVTGRSKSFLAIDALRDFLAREARQIAEIQKAIEEADAGNFASEEEVAATLNKWSANEG